VIKNLSLWQRKSDYGFVEFVRAFGSVLNVVKNHRLYVRWTYCQHPWNWRINWHWL